MASPTPLSAKPPRPVEQEKQQQPPKSYAEAAEQPPDQVNGLENTPPTQFVGKGEAEAQRSPPFSQPRHRKSGSLRLNGARKQPKEPELVVEDFLDKDGEQLTSIKLKFGDEPKPQRTQTELVSGRKAGARWERSQYVMSFHPSFQRV